ncbi:right-handed parallel beta-helix repeat-containing protein [Stenotrophomonas sp. NRRL B-14846]|uniref:right-handed parallel beta-helix repeat-containing protein n=1 Tax=Stenotrophomonas sp. NRRL B-14846 TaxID=3162882 RepID=UPI003D27A63A
MSLARRLWKFLREPPSKVGHEHGRCGGLCVWCAAKGNRTRQQHHAAQFHADDGSRRELCVLAYHQDRVIIWSLDIVGFQISTGVVGGKGIEIWDTFMRGNGIAGNGVADPTFGLPTHGTSPSSMGSSPAAKMDQEGDGEMAIYNSSNVMIDGARVIDSGASAIYLVNCVDCTIKNSVIERPGEWGIDVVQGSHRFLAENNMGQRRELRRSCF